MSYHSDEDAIISLKFNMERVEAISNNDSLYIRGIGLGYSDQRNMDQAQKNVKNALRYLLDMPELTD